MAGQPEFPNKSNEANYNWEPGINRVPSPVATIQYSPNCILGQSGYCPSYSIESSNLLCFRFWEGYPYYFKGIGDTMGPRGVKDHIDTKERWTIADENICMTRHPRYVNQHWVERIVEARENLALKHSANGEQMNFFLKYLSCLTIFLSASYMNCGLLNRAIGANEGLFNQPWS